MQAAEDKRRPQGSLGDLKPLKQGDAGRPVLDTVSEAPVLRWATRASRRWRGGLEARGGAAAGNGCSLARCPWLTALAACPQTRRPQREKKSREEEMRLVALRHRRELRNLLGFDRDCYSSDEEDA